MTALPALEHNSDGLATEHLGKPVLVVGMDDSPPSWDAFSWVDYAAIAETRDQVAEQLRNEVEHSAHGLGVEVSFVREYGEPAQALRNVAESTHADLIVVGRSAKMLHHFAGSLGRRLVLDHDLPVVAVVP